MSNKLKKKERNLIGGFDEESSYEYDTQHTRKLASTAELESRVSTYSAETRANGNPDQVIGGSTSFGFENDDSLLGGGSTSNTSESLSESSIAGGSLTDGTSSSGEIGGGGRTKSRQRSAQRGRPSRKSDSMRRRGVSTSRSKTKTPNRRGPSKAKTPMRRGPPTGRSKAKTPSRSDPRPRASSAYRPRSIPQKRCASSRSPARCRTPLAEPKAPRKRVVKKGAPKTKYKVRNPSTNYMLSVYKSTRIGLYCIVDRERVPVRIVNGKAELL